MMSIAWITFLLCLMELLNFQCICAYHEYNKVISINHEGNNSIECCVNGKCPCSSLETALQHDINNTLINITSSKATLSIQINIMHVSVIAIKGNNDTTIDCNNTGGVLFSNCKGIDIIGITWYHCGSTKLQGAISLEHSENLSVGNCKFQSSNVHGIAVQPLPGKIAITDTEFLYNNRSSNNNYGSGLFIRQTQETNPPMNLELVIIRSMFKYNGVSGSSSGGGINIQTQTTNSSSLINISIKDSTFTHNVGSSSGGMYVYAYVNNSDLNVTFQLQNATFINNSVDAVIGDYNGDAIYSDTSGNSLSFTMTSSFIYNSIIIHSKTSHTSISMDEILWGYIKGNFGFNIEIYSSLNISFSNMNLTATQVSITIIRLNSEYCELNFDRYNNSDNSNLRIDGKQTNGCKCTITNSQFSNNDIDSPIIDITNIKYLDTQQPFINISNTSISGNRNGGSIVRLAYQLSLFTPQGNVQLSSVTFTSNSAAEGTLSVYNCEVRISDKVSFSSNLGKRGGGIYFTNYSYAILSDNADIEFINNVAALGGGAIYAVHPSSDYPSPWALFCKTGKSVTFTNNAATEAGNSIYYNIPTDITPTSVDSIIHIPSKFNYSGKSYHNEIATSPYNLMLSSPAICTSEKCDDGGHYRVDNIMLGEEFIFTAKVVDYFNDSAEASMFLVQISDTYEEYSLTGFSKYKIVLIQENPLHNITIVGKEVTNYNTTITLHLSPVIGTVTSKIRDIDVCITVLLHPCKTGFNYDNQKQKCTCNNILDLVQCTVNTVRIKKGYWCGHLDGNIIVSICPNSYCDYPLCDITEDYCDLSSVQDYQCRSHRTGAACGNCEDNYTLAFDLEDCIPTSNCHIWLTILIFICVIVYWFLALLVILCITHFVNVPVITGYAYGIIYFYSILDLFVANNLVSDIMTKIIDIFSGFANLSPRFLGMLCLFKGLSGIDQQVIHYVHPLAISLLLFIISRVAKHSARVTNILGRAGIIRATCLFILLSYTSIASTSLQLLRPLGFTQSHGVHSSLTSFYTYLSPDIKYFSGRHIIYGIFAILLTILIALGLPIFLLLQPFLKKRINFIRIVPLLDQFQQCFKLQYHSFAAFYMICRLLLFLILSLDMITYSTRFLILQVLCFVIAVIQVWVQPYKEDKLNSLDQTILLIALMIVSLNVGIPYTSLSHNEIMIDAIVAILAMLPLIVFAGFLLSSTAIGRLLWQKITREVVNGPRDGSTLRLASRACMYMLLDNSNVLTQWLLHMQLCSNHVAS